VRRFSFLVIVALAVFLGYQVITGFFELRLGSYRGLLNAAWIGALMALTLSFFLSLIGFYVTRGNVSRTGRRAWADFGGDPPEQAGLCDGEICKQRRRVAVVVGVLALAALAMLLIHGEDKTLDLANCCCPSSSFPRRWRCWRRRYGRFL
jgi:hypothetical protein